HGHFFKTTLSSVLTNSFIYNGVLWNHPLWGPQKKRLRKYNERLKSFHSNGFINENSFYGGDYGETSVLMRLAWLTAPILQ
ncbi:hypothetical protein, partial [Mesorhizobium sp. M0185]|uniref:hypothetical protein n=1 Tax=Mesorhizobium sp. M0185 TaxID=2956907 RepID=UPI0033367FA5